MNKQSKSAKKAPKDGEKTAGKGGMSRHTVEKIGGTSMADMEAVMDNIIFNGRGGDALFNRIFVVSAFSGMTNLLLEHKKTGEPGVFALFEEAENEWDWSNALSSVAQEMQRINAETFNDPKILTVADRFVRERIEGVRSCLIDLQRLCSYGHFHLDEHMATVREMLAALGEAHSAHNMTLMLRQRDVPAVFVDLTSWREEGRWTMDEYISRSLADVELDKEIPVVTGYAQCREGLIGRYGRGYTEVTFSRVAVLTEAREAIIHKEYHLSSADPNIVEESRVRTIGRTNYDVADQLSNMGMEAIHPSAARGLRQNEIPLHVKNSFRPDEPGTVIDGDYSSETPRAEIVTGLRKLVALDFFEQDMVGVKGYDARILEALRKHDIRIVTKTSNANTISHYLNAKLHAVRKVVRDLAEAYPAAEISVAKVSIVSVIGSDLDVKGLTPKAIAAVAEAGIPLMGVHKLRRNVDLMLILNEENFEDAIRALHTAMIENAAEKTKKTAQKAREAA